jgi:hypothetical protein
MVEVLVKLVTSPIHTVFVVKSGLGKGFTSTKFEVEAVQFLSEIAFKATV